MATRERLEQHRLRVEEGALAPLRHTGRGFYVLVAALVAIIAWGAFAYAYQAKDGLIVTAMRDRIMWGLYISLFVFFIGASMAGTFVSAILRITKASWRTPVTRVAELVTVSALVVAALFVAFDMGRPDRLFNMVMFARWESPLVWDVYGLTAYLAGSMIYLYAALIPDMALCRDRLGPYVSPLRRWFYETLAIGWRNAPEQRKNLAMALGMMMLLIVPVAIMMHTVTSWIFAMTLREPWDSPLFGIYFVGGAIFSGTGIIIIVMAAMRRVYRLQDLIPKQLFVNLGYLLATFAAIMFFFNVNEFVVHGYKLRGQISVHLEEVFVGDLAYLFWPYFWGGIVVPIALVALPFTRNVVGIVAAAVLVNIGMFIERYLIVVGGLREPLNPYELPSYSPSWVEWSLMAAGVAIFVLLIVLSLKLIPGLAATEMIEQAEEEAKRASTVAGTSEMAPET